MELVSAILFLVVGCFAKTACDMRRNDREHLSQIMSEGGHGVGISSSGDDTVNCGP